MIKSTEDLCRAIARREAERAAGHSRSDGVTKSEDGDGGKIPPADEEDHSGEMGATS